MSIMENQIIIKITKVILVFTLIFLIGCSAFEDDEKLSMQRVDYTGNELRTDGYYYYYQWHNYLNKEQIVVISLYRNGIIRACGGGYDSFQDFESRIDIINTASSNPNKSPWGIFVIEGNVIKYEKWYGARALEPYRTRIFAGKILNDTTFHITESYRPNGRERNSEDLTFHFRQFSPKPDSTNNFIK